jgi:CHASE3 domain sensor protein
MEERDALGFVEKQLELNKKVTKTMTGFVSGLETQDRFNKQLTEYLAGQDSRIDNLTRMVVALTTFVIVTLLGVLIIVVRINS